MSTSVEGGADYELGDLVLRTVPGKPMWPAIISMCPVQKAWRITKTGYRYSRTSSAKFSPLQAPLNGFCCRLLQKNEMVWVDSSHIEPLTPERIRESNKSSEACRAFQEAEKICNARNSGIVDRELFRLVAANGQSEAHSDTAQRAEKEPEAVPDRSSPSIHATAHAHFKRATDRTSEEEEAENLAGILNRGSDSNLANSDNAHHSRAGRLTIRGSILPSPDIVVNSETEIDIVRSSDHRAMPDRSHAAPTSPKVRGNLPELSLARNNRISTNPDISSRRAAAVQEDTSKGLSEFRKSKNKDNLMKPDGGRPLDVFGNGLPDDEAQHMKNYADSSATISGAHMREEELVVTADVVENGTTEPLFQKEDELINEDEERNARAPSDNVLSPGEGKGAAQQRSVRGNEEDAHHGKADEAGKIVLREVKECKLGDLVFAKYMHHPHWPAVIARDDAKERYWKWKTADSLEVHVRFVGDFTAAWVSSKNVVILKPEEATQFYCDKNDGQYMDQLKAVETAKNIYERKQNKKMEGGKPENGNVSVKQCEHNFNLGDLVMAQIWGYPYWPARIQECPWENAEYHGKWKLEDPVRFWCYFPGDDSANWVEVERVRLFDSTTARQLISGGQSSTALVRAIEAMEKECEEQNDSENSDDEQDGKLRRSRRIRKRVQKSGNVTKGKKARTSSDEQ